LNIAVVVQGASLIGDSIANDAIWQYETLKSILGADRVCLFVETFAPEVFPTVNCRPYHEFDMWLSTYPVGIVIYHFCDGWRALEEDLRNFTGRKIVRWHNNTPPWFYVDHPDALRGTIRGLKSIRELATGQKLEVWANSEFSVRQLKILAGDRQRAICVFPASSYIESESQVNLLHRTPTSLQSGATLRILFVGRIVAHKGHKHVIAVADLIARVRGCRVVVDFVGRRDENGVIYNEELANLAQAAQCEVVFHGGLSPIELERRYHLADVFLCLSEHEGFGLPAFEAMRRGLVVVAWSNTAYEDLLVESPFALREFELASFAAAVELATDPAHQEVLGKVQSKILAQYTRKIVLTQIMNGLGLEQRDHSDFEIMDHVLTHELRAAVEKTADIYRIAENDAIGADATHDFVGNYISAYDVEYFDRLLDSQSSSNKLLELMKIEGSQTNAAVRLYPAVFSSKLGTFEEGVYTFRNLDIKQGHLIFGPYVNMPAGRFSFRFYIHLSQFSSDSPLGTEVVANQQVLVAGHFVMNGERGEGYLEYEFLAPQSDVELRINALAPIKLSGEFEGVVVERLPAVSSLVPVSSSFSQSEAGIDEAPGATLHIPARSFKTHRGRLCDDVYEIEIEPWLKEEHLFFGPYIEIPKGRYQIAINIEMTLPVRRMHLEIADAGLLVVRREVEAGSDGWIRVEEELQHDVAKGEFRLKVDADGRSRAFFHGIDIKRLATLSCLLVEGKVLTPHGIKLVVGEPRSVFFEPINFVSSYAQVADERLVFSAQIVPAGAHLIYGPYVAVPRGRFRFRLHFDFIRFETDDLVVIDVANEGKMITYLPLKASRLGENTTIECEFLEPIPLCEFRLSTRAHANVLGVFRGVTAERIPSLAGLSATSTPRGKM
jgi:glycosyltransferase involved in cell wall biosynthesis